MLSIAARCQTKPQKKAGYGNEMAQQWPMERRQHVTQTEM